MTESAQRVGSRRHQYGQRHGTHHRNWSGRPPTSHEVIVQSITATTTRTGLRVCAEPDTNTSPTGVRIKNAEMAALPLTVVVYEAQAR